MRSESAVAVKETMVAVEGNVVVVWVKLGGLSQEIDGLALVQICRPQTSSFEVDLVSSGQEAVGLADMV